VCDDCIYARTNRWYVIRIYQLRNLHLDKRVRYATIQCIPTIYGQRYIYRFIKADSKEKAIEYAMADGSPDDQDIEDTETWAEEVDNDKT